VGENRKPVLLNLGCGTVHEPGFINVDAFGNPDFIWDLEVTPFPWPDNSVDGIQMRHVLEHLDNWWECFEECARILRPGGFLRIHVPDASSDTALAYRDHKRVFSLASFHGIQGRPSGTNSWAATVEGGIPLVQEFYAQVPYNRFQWMAKYCPWLLRFCADHLRNFIWEQQFVFRKLP